MLSDADAAALYDLMNPWDAARWPGDGFYEELVMAAGWNPANAADLTDAAGRRLRVWHEVESVAGGVVTFSETTAEPGGAVLRVDRASLRFLDVATLGRFLAGAGFEIEEPLSILRSGLKARSSRACGHQ